MQFDHRSGVTGCSDKNINAYHYNPAREVVRAHRSSKSFSNHPICELDLSEVKKITWMVFPLHYLRQKLGIVVRVDQQLLLSITQKAS